MGSQCVVPSRAPVAGFHHNRESTRSPLPAETTSPRELSASTATEARGSSPIARMESLMLPSKLPSSQAVNTTVAPPATSSPLP